MGGKRKEKEKKYNNKKSLCWEARPMWRQGIWDLSKQTKRIM
jgi:hypothetical protein